MMVKISFNEKESKNLSIKWNLLMRIKKIDKLLWEKKKKQLIFYFRKKLNYKSGNNYFIIDPNQRRFLVAINGIRRCFLINSWNFKREVNYGVESYIPRKIQAMLWNINVSSLVDQRLIRYRWMREINPLDWNEKWYFTKNCCEKLEVILKGLAMVYILLLEEFHFNYIKLKRKDLLINYQGVDLRMSSIKLQKLEFNVFFEAKRVNGKWFRDLKKLYRWWYGKVYFPEISFWLYVRLLTSNGNVIQCKRH